MRKISFLLLAFVAPLILLASPVAFAHDFFVPPGVGDTPQGFDNAADDNGINLDLTNDGGAENALFRNPTCTPFHESDGGTHPPGNP